METVREIRVVPNDISNQGAPQVAGPSLGAPDVTANEVNLRDLFELLRAGKWTIVIITFAFVMLGMLFYLLVSPVYEANGLVQVEENSKNGAMSSISDLSSMFLGTPVETAAEIEILKSRMVLDQVIQKENLEISASPRYFPFLGK